MRSDFYLFTFTLFCAEAPEATCYGYMELNQDGNMITLYHRYGERPPPRMLSRYDEFPNLKSDFAFSNLA
ncbi:hypothetical protein [Paenibacillus ehimensis]|uniref:hypothetical protein n=1 Tax=Paenibacillus ehimensis TaxID=79264 RepID=UPI00398A8B26